MARIRGIVEAARGGARSEARQETRMVIIQTVTNERLGIMEYLPVSIRATKM
jgi:hypothetical protein